MNKIFSFFQKKNIGLLHELLKGGGISLFLKLGGVGLSYLLVWFITTTFGAEVFGYYTFFISVITILSILLTFGVDIYALRFSSEFITKQQWDEVSSLTLSSYSSVSILWILLSVILILFSSPVASLFSVEVEFIYGILIVLLPFSLLKLNYQFFRSIKWITIYSLFKSVLIPFLTFVTLFFLVQSDGLDLLNVYLPISAYSFSVILLVTSGSYIWFKFLTRKTVLTKVLKKVREDNRFKFYKLISRSFPFMLASSIILIGNQVDQVLIKILDSSEMLGIYMVAFKISMVISFPLVAINTISAPKFSEYFGLNDMKNLEATAKYTSNLCMFVSMIPFLIIMIFASQLLSFFGDEFTTATDVLRLLAVGQYITASFGSVGILLQMTDNQNILFITSLITITLHILLIIILLPIYGILGVAIASISTLFLRNLIFSLFAKKKLGFKPISII